MKYQPSEPIQEPSTSTAIHLEKNKPYSPTWRSQSTEPNETSPRTLSKLSSGLNLQSRDQKNQDSLSDVTHPQGTSGDQKSWLKDQSLWLYRLWYGTGGTEVRKEESPSSEKSIASHRTTAQNNPSTQATSRPPYTYYSTVVPAQVNRRSRSSEKTQTRNESQRGSSELSTTTVRAEVRTSRDAVVASGLQENEKSSAVKAKVNEIATDKTGKGKERENIEDSETQDLKNNEG
jgi:hypothetical protein